MESRTERIAIGAAVLHTLLIAAYVLPTTWLPLRLVYWSQAYTRPLWHQQWKLFAPDPPACACRLEVVLNGTDQRPIQGSQDHYLVDRMSNGLCRYLEAGIQGDTLVVPGSMLKQALANFTRDIGREVPELRYRMVRHCATDAYRPEERTEEVVPIRSHSAMAHEASIRLFGKLVNLWVLAFIVSGLSAAEWLWMYPISPPLALPGIFASPTNLLANASDLTVTIAIAVLLLVTVRNLLRPLRWWASLLTWTLYMSVMHRAWLAGSGGQQLVGVMLFWQVFMSIKTSRTDRPVDQAIHGLRLFAFWCARLQLLLAYAATAAHKFTGTAWLDGTAMGIIATDPATT